MNKHLTEEQARKLLEAIVTLALVTGMRRDELLSLKWQDIDLEKRELRVPHTKTKSSNRMIHFPEVVTEVLKQHHMRQMEARLDALPKRNSTAHQLGTLASTRTPTHFSSNKRPCEQSRCIQLKHMLPMKVCGFHVIARMAEVQRHPSASRTYVDGVGTEMEQTTVVVQKWRSTNVPVVR